MENVIAPALSDDDDVALAHTEAGGHVCGDVGMPLLVPKVFASNLRHCVSSCQPNASVEGWMWKSDLAYFLMKCA